MVEMRTSSAGSLMVPAWIELTGLRDSPGAAERHSVGCKTATRGAPMHWTDDDTTDVGAAAAALRALAERLEADARNRRPGGRTRDALDACIARLLELDDVYFEGPEIGRAHV